MLEMQNNDCCPSPNAVVNFGDVAVVAKSLNNSSSSAAAQQPCLRTT